MRRLKLRLVVALLPLAFGLSAHSQNLAGNVFAPIPEDRQARLVARLRLLIEYQRAQQWSRQYDLLASSVRRPQSRRDYAALSRRPYSEGGRLRLQDFTPVRVNLIQVDARQRVWFIAGCAQVIENGRRVNRAAAVEAYWERNDWFFSPVQGLGRHNSAAPCSSEPQGNESQRDYE